MNLSDMITRKDLGEPYSRLIDFLSLEEIIKIEQLYNGEQIAFAIDSKNINNDYPKLSMLIGEEKTRKFLKTLGGMGRVYFPTLKKSAREKIKNLIFREFNGYNYFELAKRFGYTERHIRHILKDKNKHKPVDERQMTFADVERLNPQQ